MSDYLPAALPGVATSIYRRGDGTVAVQVAAKSLFSFDVAHRKKMWWVLPSERAPFGRFIEPQTLHRNPGRVPLHVAQILFWNGWSLLDSDVEPADELHHLSDVEGTAFQRYEGDLLARAAYMFAARQAAGQVVPSPRPDEIFLAKQMLAQFDEQLGEFGLTMESWAHSDLGNMWG
ncbi:hypothetical protein [Microbacterium aurantiacum]|uniref:Uncharacterized protein n=1 Tax=Microbacterium aurantiacum TaxID=162393 RepID=A0AAJ2HG86_9MICO|nr:hypothetical protein [Microbacterium aurantiacum]MDS0246947.1 hypothetical protein [Microbacterium aurantiacum]